MEPWLVLLAIIIVAVFLWLTVAAFYGAIYLLQEAATVGCFGVVTYFALWIFFFPVMLVVCIIVGLCVMHSA